MKKSVLLILVVAIIVCASAVGGTVAWLVDRAIVTNTFVVGSISIVLTETTGSSYQLIPGATVQKDPKLTVKHDSEACWLFVKVEKTNDFDSYLHYTIADGWTEYADGVYYRLFDSVSSVDVTYSIIKDDAVTVKDGLTEAQMSALKASGAYPSLKFTAYAVQKSGVSSAQDAWEIVNKS